MKSPGSAPGPTPILRALEADPLYVKHPAEFAQKGAGKRPIPFAGGTVRGDAGGNDVSSLTPTEKFRRARSNTTEPPTRQAALYVIHLIYDFLELPRCQRQRLQIARAGKSRSAGCCLQLSCKSYQDRLKFPIKLSL